MVMIEKNDRYQPHTAMAAVMRFDCSTLIQIIDKLKARKFVIRNSSDHDRRSHALKLTSAGKRIILGLKSVSTRETYMTKGLTGYKNASLKYLLGKNS